MEHALVTGGCGFLGSSIVRCLLDRGVRVRILALPSEPADNVAGLEVEILRGDVLSPEDCTKAVDGIDTVFHAAAIYKSWMPDPSLMYQVNSSGTFNMLEASRRAGVKTVVYTASIVSLGRPPRGTLGDENTEYKVWKLDFPYSRSKYHSRMMAEDFARWGMDVRVVCPGIIFGPRDIAPTPSGKLIIESVKGGAPPVVMDGGASYVDVRDAAEVHVLAAEKGKPGERYLATAHNLSNQDFVDAISRALGRHRRYYRLPVPAARAIVHAMNIVAEKTGQEPPLADVFFEYSLVPSYFRNDKARTELGATFRPIEESIRDAVAYFRETGQVD